MHAPHLRGAGLLCDVTTQSLYEDVLALNETCTKAVDGSLSSPGDLSCTTKSGANPLQGGLTVAATVLSTVARSCS